jgi:hypothetical protein
MQVPWETVQPQQGGVTVFSVPQPMEVAKEHGVYHLDMQQPSRPVLDLLFVNDERNQERSKEKKDLFLIKGSYLKRKLITKEALTIKI